MLNDVKTHDKRLHIRFGFIVPFIILGLIMIALAVWKPHKSKEINSVNETDLIVKEISDLISCSEERVMITYPDNNELSVALFLRSDYSDYIGDSYNLSQQIYNFLISEHNMKYYSVDFVSNSQSPSKYGTIELHYSNYMQKDATQTQKELAYLNVYCPISNPTDVMMSVVDRVTIYEYDTTTYEFLRNCPNVTEIDITGDSDNNSSDKNNVIEEIRGFVPDSCRIRIS